MNLEVRGIKVLGTPLLGLRSTVRTTAAAYWANWGDSFGMIQQRHPAVAKTLVHEFVGCQSQSVHLLRQWQQPN